VERVFAPVFDAEGTGLQGTLFKDAVATIDRPGGVFGQVEIHARLPMACRAVLGCGWLTPMPGSATFPEIKATLVAAREI
jgi:hypothetical protein